MDCENVFSIIGIVEIHKTMNIMMKIVCFNYNTKKHNFIFLSGNNGGHSG